MAAEKNGRPPIIKWPGLETKRNTIDLIDLCSRRQEIDMEVLEAASRERKYSESGAEIDIENLKFSCEPDEKHTTIDFSSVTDEDQRVRITTNDYVLYNRIKKLMSAAPDGEWLIEDLKLNRTGSAVFFVTVTCPLLETRKIFNRYLQNRHETLD
jgi:hypothetical protein